MAWDFLTPKRRQMLDAGWPGLFRKHMLPSIPVAKLGKHFNAIAQNNPEEDIFTAGTNEPAKDRYRWRAGVEATMSEYDRRTGAKQLRVRGLKAVKFCATLKALGVNIFRAAAIRAAIMMPEEVFCEA